MGDQSVRVAIVGANDAKVPNVGITHIYEEWTNKHFLQNAFL